MAAFDFRRRTTRRWWYAGATLLAAAFAAVFFVVGAGATIGASNFEGNDGNLVVDHTGNTDWVNAPNLSVGQDLATGTSDNSFGQGTKEDNSNVTVVTGSIPNSKADLGRFAVAGEVIGSDTYMYLAWTRENQSGTVNFDFELNQKAQPDLTTPGAKTLNRTVNDVLINYAFAGGSNTPTLTRYHWNGSNWVSDGTISGTCSEGATNSQTISENLGGLPAVSRPAQQFGEASINLSCAGVVPANSCEPFSSAYVKSRSSTSFTSEIKDFIAPVALHISSCGALKITKASSKSAATPLKGATFHITGPNSYSNDVSTGDDGTVCLDNLPNGTYHVTETGAPNGYAIDDSTTHDISVSGKCSGTGTSAAATLNFTDTPKTDITVEAKSQVTGGTKSSISCVNSGGDSTGTGGSLAEDSKLTATGVAPDTYTCTIVVDP
jgi:hypothetical protein